MHAWTASGKSLRLVEHARARDDPDPKALACDGLLLRQGETADRMYLRFVDGRPVSAITTQFLTWCCDELAAAGTTALLLVWDNASWHVSQHVRAWMHQHNVTVKPTGQGVRIIGCCLPIKSPWLNPIEPTWVHAKRKVVEPDALLTAQSLAERICAVFNCPHHPHLTLTEAPP